jgi:hypothetical protein
MGEASHRKREGREAKDPLRYQRANIAAKAQYVERLSNAYHAAKADYDQHVAKYNASAEKLKANGHPLYTDAPEAAPVADAESVEVASSDAVE